MFTNEILKKYAEVMIWGLGESLKEVNGEFKKGDIIQINFDAKALSLAEIIFTKLIKMGFHPIYNMLSTPIMQLWFYELASEEQLTFMPPWAKMQTKNIKGSINLCAPASLDHLKNVDPHKIAFGAKSKKPLKDIRKKLAQKGSYCWTLATLPTKALADMAGLSLKDYTNEVIKACYLDMPDPIARWEETKRQSGEIIKWLQSMDIEKLHIESDNIDLFVYPGEQRRWASGRGCNIPSFEIFTSPDCRKTHGIYYANMKSFHGGKLTEGMRLEFKKGKIIDVSAEKEENFIREIFSADKGAAMLGEFSLTDRRHSRISHFMANTLYDENTGGEYGNCHIAPGSSFTDLYTGKESLTKNLMKKIGFNDSAIHWDLVNTERKRVSAYLKNGIKKVIYIDGEFTL
ncbi:hypothetical protein A2331_06865 [Candidatus Falkowbacteria bacterium RIFOXYB2_FULL_34_18]|uniref:Peptidase M29 n=1 Tax=Candidatus Falkowbacteria bacterium RIFOXYD2_FULL_34_120 TaxID=1798007 RepID=A0A1F5TRH0_9BACT|nr:MAG: hypothetical protein A2331_06865 [Candidatus Falkowbacteria bacterium RIFOXYB2_FULL_34_18]OGF29957.1 MAG: hypothetical protein A2500_03810 [Candidatus Falkowbacteria bacterium RIFOXYC12_FULL_34_55]OGF37185.1 MAG: hypothetical protein A2466_02705 [Candidatus Falkowbacteria bacterium RIFOXYC2_FULL_34_220]OGF39495.1 MAG: hypothetical protein A2515_04185 [Candidatus Falkowbacteria bacterium RIFOXYD12_FULL_34_57]OGF41523.1 MAG: hypothetical protein A2531_02420 [Candidatus Falkowbacteria bact